MAAFGWHSGEVTRTCTGTRLDDQAHAMLTNAFVKWLRSSPAGVRTFCEVPFCHYGERGSIDVVAVVQTCPAKPWHGIACELKPALLNLNETMRQVTKAQNYFQMPSSISAFGQPTLRFLLVLQATESNYVTVTQYSDVLDGIEIHFFDLLSAFRNPFEQAWRQQDDDNPEHQRAQHPSGSGSLYGECSSSM